MSGGGHERQTRLTPRRWWTLAAVHADPVVLLVPLFPQPGEVRVERRAKVTHCGRSAELGIMGVIGVE